MDGISTVASLLPLVALTLQSIKLIHEAVVDGPKKLSRLADQATGLRGLVKQIDELLAYVKQADVNVYPSRLDELQKAAQVCNNDLQAILIRLSKLRAENRSKVTRNVLTALKTHIVSAEIERIGRTLEQHTQVFASQLSVLGRYFDIHLMRQVVDANWEIRSAFAKVSTEVNALQSCGQKAHSVKDDHLHSFGSLKLEVNGNGNGNGWPPFGGLTVRRDADVDRIGSAISPHRADSQPTKEQFNKVADSHPSMSNTQFQQITGLLRQIQEQTSTRPPRVLGYAETRNEPSLAKLRNNSAALFEKEISCCFNRLCRSINRKLPSLSSAEAQLAMNDLEQTILAFERNYARRHSNHLTQSRKRKWHDEEILPSHLFGDPANLDLQRARKVLSASSKVAVVTEDTYGTVQRSPRNYYFRRAHSYFQRSKHGAVMICCNTSTPNHSSHHSPLLWHNGAHNNTNLEIETFEGNVTIIPSDPRYSFAMTISFLQRVTAQGSSIPNPKLFYRAIIPSDSKIFLAIRYGDFNRFLDLLHGRQASVTDRDERGRSLLGHAIANSQPAISKFLIEQGADVDALEPSCHESPSDLDEKLYVPLCQVLTCRRRVSELQDVLWDANELETNSASEETSDGAIECQRLLLQAGADPLLGCSSYTFTGSAFDGLLDSNYAGPLQMYLNLGNVFIDLETKDENGRTALLRLLTSISYEGLDQTRADMFKLLIERGANIRVRDSMNGGPLHYVFRSTIFESADILLDCLVFALNHGAAIHGTDTHGYSATFLAFASGWGPEWCNVLQASDHNHDVLLVLVEDHRQFHVWSDHGDFATEMRPWHGIDDMEIVPLDVDKTSHSSQGYYRPPESRAALHCPVCDANWECPWLSACEQVDIF